MNTDEAFNAWWDNNDLDRLHMSKEEKAWMLQSFIAGVMYTCDRWEASMRNRSAPYKPDSCY